MLSKPAANLVKGGLMYQQNIAPAGISDPCDLPSNLIFINLHINKHAWFDDNGQSLLGYTAIDIYLVFN